MSKNSNNYIISKAYSECETKIKSNLNKYKKYMSKFITERNKQLYSIMPSEQIYFSQSDEVDFFSSTLIDKNKIHIAIENTYYYPIANFNPRYAKDECTVALLCIVRYFYLKKMPKELDLALINMAFSGKYYPSIWYGSFPTAAPQEHIMEYVVTKICTNKFDIVREGSVISAVKSIANTWVDTYSDKFKSFEDDDCVYLIQQLHNRIRSFMNNIAELYYQAYNDKDNLYITYDSDDISEENYHLSDSDSLKLERIVSNTMNYINTHGVNYQICKTASNKDVKMDEIKSIIENILADNKNMPQVREYITLLVATFFRQSSIKRVTDISFVTYCIKPKPNTKDQYLVRLKELNTSLLLNNAEHFARRRNRLATEAAYYKSFNAYFALLIQECN